MAVHSTHDGDPEMVNRISRSRPVLKVYAILVALANPRIMLLLLHDYGLVMFRGTHAAWYSRGLDLASVTTSDARIRR